MTFKYLKKECPVCNGARKDADCRSTESNGKTLFFCRHDSPSPLYALVGYDRTGFAMYLHESDYNGSKRNNFDWQAEDAKREKEQKQKEAFRKTWLTESQRDTEFRKLIPYFGLNEAHKQDLIRRGIDPSLAYRNGFRSFTHKSVPDVSNKLPGISNGRYKGYEGMFCPAYDPHGAIVGGQVSTKTNKNKALPPYAWLKAGAGSYPSNLNVGKEELPITVWRYDDNIGLCEGLLKPFIASNRHGMTMLGAAGGNFASSPILTLRYLEELFTDKLSERLVTLYPDAACVSNNSVYNRDLKTIKLLQDNGYTVRVASWGQFWDKTKGDIDEIPAGTKFEFLTAEEFASLDPNNIPTDQANFLAGLVGKIRKYSGFKFSPIRQVNDENKKADKTPYVFGKLPYREAYDGSLFEFHKADHASIYREAGRKGYKYVYDQSGTGSGKSYIVGSLMADGFFTMSNDDKKVRRLFYFTQSSRNPTIEEIERDFAEVPVRHTGFYLDNTRQTPMGKPFRVTPEDGKPAMTEGNCHWTNYFRILQENGNPTQGVCSKCPFFEQCARDIGDGFGFRYESMQAQRNRKMRGNIQGIGPDHVNSNTDVAIVDEYSQSLNFVDTLQFKPMEALMSIDLEDADQLTLMAAIKRVNQVLQVEDKGHYGLDHKSILEALGEIPASVKDLIQSGRLEIAIANKFPSPEDVSRGNFNPIDTSLVTFLRVWAGLLKGSFRCYTNDYIEVTFANQRLIDTLQAFHVVVFQDATGSREELAMFLGCEPKEILLIRQQETQVPNLKITHVQGLGKAGSARSADCARRIAAIEATLNEKYGDDIGYIDFIKHGRAKGWLCHFSDARGSNAYQDKLAVASFGAPYPNIGALQSVYQTFTELAFSVDSAPEAFSKYCDEKLIAEVLQEIGRLRANRRLDTKLNYYICSDIDTKWLIDRGYNVKLIDAIDISPDAGTIQQRAIRGYKDAYLLLKENGEKLTMSAVAKAANRSVSALSQIAAKLGGWEQFQALIQNMMSGEPKEEVNEEILQDYIIPMVDVFAVVLEDGDDKELIEGMGDILDIAGINGLYHLVSRLSFKHAAIFLYRVCANLPTYIARQCLNFLRPKNLAISTT